ncbi:DUF3159 domain-containing protein [Nakamurella flavida]|uniref:DUF3159 domain-containing protein n=2 Tax=Nakamurella flavida TaxID=363630 RepID=A0A939C178_9ACTN|nr:DUF3159 domain-containing protein [Nakamurella flavida]
MGGPMGMVDSAVPVAVFILGNTLGGLGWGIGTALGSAVVLAGIRLARRKPITQVVSGIFGVGIAAFIAYRTGSAKGFFLLGIWSSVAYGAAFALSILVRWPLVGVIWELVNSRGTAWRADRRLVRRYSLATGVWVLVFAARFFVQNFLYDQDEVGWLATARIVMGYPLWLVALGITVLLVRGHLRSRPTAAPAAG